MCVYSEGKEWIEAKKNCFHECLWFTWGYVAAARAVTKCVALVAVVYVGPRLPEIVQLRPKGVWQSMVVPRAIVRRLRPSHVCHASTVAFAAAFCECCDPEWCKRISGAGFGAPYSTPVPNHCGQLASVPRPSKRVSHYAAAVVFACWGGAAQRVAIDPYGGVYTCTVRVVAVRAGQCGAVTAAGLRA